MLFLLTPGAYCEILLLTVASKANIILAENHTTYNAGVNAVDLMHQNTLQLAVLAGTQHGIAVFIRVQPYFVFQSDRRVGRSGY